MPMMVVNKLLGSKYGNDGPHLAKSRVAKKSTIQPNLNAQPISGTALGCNSVIIQQA
jgi:hypothetical protein